MASEGGGGVGRRGWRLEGGVALEGAGDGRRKTLVASEDAGDGRRRKARATGGVGRRGRRQLPPCLREGAPAKDYKNHNICIVPLFDNHHQVAGSSPWRPTSQGEDMSEVTSVNGKTGEVVLKAADVEAIPASEAGEPNGVATLDSGGKLHEAQLPSAAVTSSRIGAAGESEKVLSATDWAAFSNVLTAHGEVEGAQKPDLSKGGVHTYIATAAFTLAAPINPPTTNQVIVVTVKIKEDATGGHAIASEGITWRGGEPVWTTTSNAENITTLISFDGGLTWTGLGPEKGATGEKGTTGEKGATGAEGFSPLKLLLPKVKNTYFKTNANERESRQGLSASHNERGVPSTAYPLTSGTPVGALMAVPAKTVLRGVGFAVKALEGTPANRTHLWVCLGNAAGKVIATGKDYTSSTNTPLIAATMCGLLLDGTYETGAEPELLQVYLCETMSSANPIEIYAREGVTVIEDAEPKLSLTGPAGQTTPPAVNTEWTPADAAREPYLVLI